MTSIIDAPLKLTSQLCRNRALEARVMKDQADGDSATRITLEHIAETWEQIAQQLQN